MYVCMYVCMYVMYVCMHACVYVCTYVTYVCTRLSVAILVLCFLNALALAVMALVWIATAAKPSRFRCTFETEEHSRQVFFGLEAVASPPEWLNERLARLGEVKLEVACSLLGLARLTHRGALLYEDSRTFVSEESRVLMEACYNPMDACLLKVVDVLQLQRPLPITSAKFLGKRGTQWSNACKLEHGKTGPRFLLTRLLFKPVLPDDWMTMLASDGRSLHDILSSWDISWAQGSRGFIYAIYRYTHIRFGNCFFPSQIVTIRVRKPTFETIRAMQTLRGPADHSNSSRTCQPANSSRACQGAFCNYVLDAHAHCSSVCRPRVAI